MGPQYLGGSGSVVRRHGKAHRSVRAEELQKRVKVSTVSKRRDAGSFETLQGRRHQVVLVKLPDGHQIVRFAVRIRRSS